MVGPRKLLAGRFAFQGFVESERATAHWLAVEADTGRRVVATVVDRKQWSNLERARGVAHRHLASVLDVIRKVERESVPENITLPDGAGIAVVEFVPGRTLRDVLGGKPMSPGKSVAWTLRLVEAVQALHGKGAIHGAISPRSVLAEAEGRAIAPVLSRLVAPPIGAFCPPERLNGAAESRADDVWALHALLYTALTGSAPFPAATREALSKQMLLERPKSLRDHGIEEPALAEIVERGLVGEKAQRVSELGEFRRALDGWERDPRAMPVKRPVPPRRATPAAEPVALRLGTVPDDGIVIDDTALPDDDGRERSSPRAAAKPPAPPRAPAAPASAPAHASPAPRAPATTPSLPSRDVSMPPPPLQAFSAASPQVSLTPARRPPPLPSPPAAAPQPAEPGRDVHTVSAVVAALSPPAPRATRASVNPFERKRNVWPFVLLAAAVSGGAVYLSVGASSTEPRAQEHARPPAIPLVTKAPLKPKPEEDRTACVRSYFPEEAFADAPSFDFVCEAGDFRDVSRQVFAKAKATPATRASANLGWYELPATAIIRKRCCSGSSPLILPPTAGWCEQLQDVLRRVEADSAKAGDLAPATRNFDKAVTCLYANRIWRPYVYERPNAAQRQAFEEFLSRAAISEARR